MTLDCGRDAHCWAPPAQIRTGPSQTQSDEGPLAIAQRPCHWMARAMLKCVIYGQLP